MNVPHRIRMKSFIAAFISILLAVFLLTACPQGQGRGLRVAIISLDGLGDWILDRLLAEGAVPNIAGLAENSFVADYAYTSFPAITAVAHALLWTGTDPSHNAIHGNQLIMPPYDRRTAIDGHTGFHALPLRAEPIWAAVARQGKKALVVQATQAAPFDVYLGENARFPAPPDNLIIFDGYIDGEVPEEVINRVDDLASASSWPNLPAHNGEPLGFQRDVGETHLYFLLYDMPSDPVTGLDTLAICSEADGGAVLDTLKSHPAADDTEFFSGAIQVTFDGKQGSAFFRLFSLEPDGSGMLLYRTRVKHLACSDPAARAKMTAELPGFTGNAAIDLYEQGAFGTPFYEGGDGSAEQVYLETARHSTELSAKALVTGLADFDWDLLVGYLAFPDEQQHSWLGYAVSPSGDPDSPTGRKAWSCLLETYAIIDEYIGAALKALPDDAILIIVSDHGFTAIDKFFYPNTVLRDAGLLVLRNDGEVDLAKTAAVYYPGNSCFVLVNTLRFKDGWVSERDAPAVIERATQALLAARDESGRKPVTGVLIPSEDEELGMTGPYAGDIYLELEQGYYPSGALDRPEIARQVRPMGVHQGDPRSARMHSIFIAGGKPVQRRIDIGVVRGIDVAPTIAALLGLKSPANATGAPLREMLQDLKRVN